MNTVTITAESLPKLKAAYQRAVDEGRDTFFFEGNEYVVGYAKYLIEYVEPRLGREIPHDR